MEQKFYRKPWDKEKVNILIEWWPHFGSYVMADILGIERKQIKAKVNKLKLKLLEKDKRLCVDCKTEFQYARHAGVRCKKCFLARRAKLRSSFDENADEELLLKRFINSALRTLRYRTKGSDLSCEYMLDLWNKQKGKCFYSEVDMIPYKYGKGRNLFSASVDRIDSNLGYFIGNVVWCCWGCNAGKSTMTYQQYFDLCKAVVANDKVLVKLEEIVKCTQLS